MGDGQFQSDTTFRAASDFEEKHLSRSQSIFVLAEMNRQKAIIVWKGPAKCTGCPIIGWVTLYCRAIVLCNQCLSAAFFGGDRRHPTFMAFTAAGEFMPINAGA